MPNPYSLSPVKSIDSQDLVVLGFADEEGAFALRNLLSELEEESIIEIGDAVVATRNPMGKVRLHQSLPLVAARMAVGSFTGMVAGMLLLNPLLGVVVGAGAGALSGVLGDVGIDDTFIRKLGETLTPGTSALFVMVGQRKREPMEDRLKPFAGKCKVLQTSLPPENAARLRQFIGDVVDPLTSSPPSATQSTTSSPKP